MKKSYRFTVEFSVEINEGIIHDARERNENIKQLIKVFISNDETLLNYFKLYFLDTFSLSDHYKEISRMLAAVEEDVLMADVSKQTPAEVSAYIDALFNPGKEDSQTISENLRVATRDFFYNQFGDINIEAADFSEVEAEDKEER